MAYILVARSAFASAAIYVLRENPLASAVVDRMRPEVIDAEQQSVSKRTLRRNLQTMETGIIAVSAVLDDSKVRIGADTRAIAL